MEEVPSYVWGPSCPGTVLLLVLLSPDELNGSGSSTATCSVGVEGVPLLMWDLPKEEG